MRFSNYLFQEMLKSMKSYTKISLVTLLYIFNSIANA